MKFVLFLVALSTSIYAYGQSYPWLDVQPYRDSIRMDSGVLIMLYEEAHPEGMPIKECNSDVCTKIFSSRILDTGDIAVVFELEEEGVYYVRYYRIGHDKLGVVGLEYINSSSNGRRKSTGLILNNEERDSNSFDTYLIQQDGSVLFKSTTTGAEKKWTSQYKSPSQ